MFRMFNRLAWVTSLVFAFSFLVVLAILSDFGDDMFDSDTFFVWFFLIVLFGGIFKNTFFSKDFINSQLRGSLPILEIEKKNDAKNGEMGFISNIKNVSDDVLLEKINNLDEEKMTPLESVNNDVFNKNQKVKQENINSEFILKQKNAEADDELFNGDSGDNVEIRQKPLELNFFQKFFQENALAKIGGILLFLGVMFLLQLVYTAIGSVGKITIGFAIGFMVFGVGVLLAKKGYSKESRILLGTAILINYLVILSGRYLIGDEMLSGQMLLSEGFTFFFLILNTVFAVTVSLAYASHSLLFFSFVIAYLNPFLIGAQPSTAPYTLLFYGLIISFGALSLSYFYKKKFPNYSMGLLSTAFLGGNVLILLAPFTTTTEWLLKLAFMVFLSFSCIYLAYGNDQKNNMAQYFILTYLFFVMLLGFGNLKLGTAISDLEIVIGYSLFLLLMLFAVFFVFARMGTTVLYYLLFSPLIILIGLVYGDILHVGNIIFILSSTVLLYLVIFTRLVDTLTVTMKYSFFTILGFFVFVISSFIHASFGGLLFGSGSDVSILNIQAYGVFIASFIFLFSAYYFSFKERLEYLYSLGTIFGIFMLLPVLTRDGALMTLSVVSIFIVALLNVLLPFVNKVLLKSSLYNLLIGLLAGILFVVFEIFYFFFGDVNQSKLILGVGFLILAIFYFVLGFFIYEKLRNSLRGDDGDERKHSSRNIVLTFLGISISLFSLAVVYVFSSNSEVVAVIWLFESSLLYYFYKKTKDIKVYFTGSVLMLIGLIKLATLLSLVETGDYLFLIPVVAVFVSLAISLKFLDFEKKYLRYFYDAGHIIGVFLLAALLMNVIPSHHLGYNFFGISVLFLLLFLVYGQIYNAYIKTFTIWIFAIVLFFHVVNLYSIFDYLNQNNLIYLKYLQYLTTVIFALGVYVFNKLMYGNKGGLNYEKSLIVVVKITLFFYLFIISTLFIYDFFDHNSFTVTIYWGIVAFIFLSYGIKNNLIRYRTLGLYILTLTIIKILLYDVWSGLNDAVIRVIALMVVGGLMIVISLLYAKKYGGHLKGEFDLKNLSDNK